MSAIRGSVRPATATAAGVSATGSSVAVGMRSGRRRRRGRRMMRSVASSRDHSTADHLGRLSSRQTRTCGGRMGDVRRRPALSASGGDFGNHEKAAGQSLGTGRCGWRGPGRCRVRRLCRRAAAVIREPESPQQRAVLRAQLRRVETGDRAGVSCVSGTGRAPEETVAWTSKTALGAVAGQTANNLRLGAYHCFCGGCLSNRRGSSPERPGAVRRAAARGGVRTQAACPRVATTRIYRPSSRLAARSTSAA